MKKLFTLVFILMISIPALAQIDLRGGMGISFSSTPALKDYLNQSYASYNNEVGSFYSTVSFAGEAGYFITNTFQLSIEASYSLNSFTFGSTIGQYDLSYGITAPTIIAYYVLPGIGYYFKFGGGVGPRFLSVDEKQPGSPVTDKFSTTGFGLLLKGEANTSLGSGVFANLGGDICYDAIGVPKQNGTPLRNSVIKEDVSFNTLSFGVHLGLTYKF
ncbi:MAG: hypothetical protein K8H86_00545 [Ignavibacteriaceae bacterium]|nr:hypothetical protein [Ignavibacteriaceae bacterium]